jgi:hypothetical protein
MVVRGEDLGHKEGRNPDAKFTTVTEDTAEELMDALEKARNVCANLVWRVTVSFEGTSRDGQPVSGRLELFDDSRTGDLSQLLAKACIDDWDNSALARDVVPLLLSRHCLLNVLAHLSGAEDGEERTSDEHAVALLAAMPSFLPAINFADKVKAQSRRSERQAEEERAATAKATLTALTTAPGKIAATPQRGRSTAGAGAGGHTQNSRARASFSRGTRIIPFTTRDGAAAAAALPPPASRRQRCVKPLPLPLPRTLRVLQVRSALRQRGGSPRHCPWQQGCDCAAHCGRRPGCRGV